MGYRALLLRRPCIAPARRGLTTAVNLPTIEHVEFPNDALKPWPKKTQMPVKYRRDDKSAVTLDFPKGSRILTLKASNEGLTTVTKRELRAVNQHVRMWDENFMVQMAVVQGPGTDFCSGLNLRDIRGSEQQVRVTLEALARLVTSMRRCRAPLISLINGASYGMAGYALASGRYRICTEKSMFCIPEASLGLGLASGLSFVLPRLCDGHKPLGLCLALTGMALQGADLVSAQLASQYFTCATLQSVVERMTDVQSFPHNPFEKEDLNTTGAGREAVLNIIEDHALVSWNVDGLTTNDYTEKDKDGKPVPHSTPLHGILPEVERVFSVDNVEQAMENLMESKEPWAQLALDNMRKASPLSLKVMFEQVTRGATKGIQECLDEEFAVNMRLFAMEDFARAMDARDNPEKELEWSTGPLESVSSYQVAALFEPMNRPRRT